MGNRPSNEDLNSTRENQRSIWFYENIEESSWIPFGDIENQLIENAFQQRISPLELDGFIIDFDKKIRISKDKTSIKRTLIEFNEIPVRSERFNTSEKPVQSLNEQNHRRFLNQSRKKFGKMSLNDLVENAAQGIVQEGLKLNKQCEAQWIAEQLKSVQQKCKEDVEKLILYLYTFESFLYRLINQTLRENDLEKIETLGPFIQILFQTDCSPTTNKVGFHGILYRGAQLDEKTIESYRESIGSIKTWDAFASTSQNRNQAECYGNVLFIINHQKQTRYKYSGMDISLISYYPAEQEVLIRAGRDFLVENVEEDTIKNKVYIYLSLS